MFSTIKSILDQHSLLFVSIISAIIILLTIQDGHSWGGDFSLYINQSKHLVEDFDLSNLYHWNKISMEESLEPLGPYLYPQGFPILLSLVYGCFGMNFIAMKIFCSIFFLLTIPLVYSVFSKIENDKIFLNLLVVTIALNFNYLVFSNNILSDFPFCFFCFFSFYLMNQKVSLFGQLLLGATMFYAYFIRDVGVFLIPTYVTYQIIYSKKFLPHQYLSKISYCAFFILFLFSKYLFPFKDDSLWQLLISNISFDLVFSNLLFYISLLPSYFLGFNNLFMGSALALLMCIGAFSKPKQYSPYIIFVALNAAIFLVWPYRQGLRFLFVILPFLSFFLLEGGLKVFRMITLKKNLFLQIVGLYCFVLLITAPKDIYKRYFRDYTINQSYTSEMQEIYSFLSDLQNNEDIVIGFRKPRVLHLFSDTKSIYTDLNNFNNSIADYLLISKDSITDQSQYNFEKEFSNYVLIKKTNTQIAIESKIKSKVPLRN